MSHREYIERLSAAYDAEMGPPSDRLTLRREPPEEGVPEELDVLLHYVDEVLPPDGVTMMLTAGLSCFPMEGPHDRVELGYEFLGECAEANRRPFARALAHLGTAPLLDRQPIYPGLTLENVDLPPFGTMSFGVVAHWPLLTEMFIAGSEPPVLLYRIIPLFEAEAHFLEEREPVRGLSELRARGLEYENQHRESVV